MLGKRSWEAVSIRNGEVKAWYSGGLGGTQEGLGRYYPRLWLARGKNGSRGGMDRTRARLLAMEMQWKCTAWTRSR